MKNIHDKYRKITGQRDVPRVMELNHGRDVATLEEFLDAHFHLHLNDVLNDGSKVDGLFDILKTSQGTECHALIVYHDGTQQRSLYFEVEHVDDPLVHEAIRVLAEGSKLDLRLKGRDVHAVVRQLAPYIGPERVKEITGEHAYGEVYDHKDEKDSKEYKCIDARVTANLGLHLRVANDLVKGASGNANLLIRRGNKQVQAYSMMGLLSLGASHGTNVTLMSSGPEAEREVTQLYSTWINANRVMH